MNINRSSRYVPIVAAIGVVVGIIIGTFFANRFTGNRLNIINTSSNKLSDLLHIIDDQYVDTVNIAEIVEQAMPKLLDELDPHSTYISAKDAKTANDDLKGSFSGIGVQFTIRKDTVRITNIIKGGPSEKVGLLAGDKIISINGKPYVGKEVTNEETMHRLKGEKDTKVKLGILRNDSKKPLYFTIIRGDIPVKSIDATYMINDELGYIKIKNFGETTYAELLTSLAELQEEDFSGLIIDLRGNGGGYLASAIQMINEFLPEKSLIVYTQGRKVKREEYYSDGRGSYQDIPLIILTDEFSASAAEIFSGAIQDNDRGVIIGRRTFGKGLVQQPINFSDGSMLRLTVARYYTPSGRCIQKPYTKGHNREEYEMDIVTRYQHGEFFNADSIHQTGEKFHTNLGRVVYGGGGIMPDYFVAEDTTQFTSYYNEVYNKGLFAQFCLEFVDANRKAMQDLDNAADISYYLLKQNTLDKFIRYCDDKGVKRRNNMIIKSKHAIERSVYSGIIYYLLDMNEYMKYLNQEDATVNKAIEIFKNKEYKPKAPEKDKEKSKNTSKAA
ncbi:MAG: S41 family peptidase [Bacteroidaceae bacterium]|nr:S41 family peptidase [Bacteroidaceae bacterium]